MSEPPATWQIGAGDGTRFYFKLFEELGAALLGPSHRGPWSEHAGYVGSDARFIRAFATKPRTGDLCLVRRSRHEIEDVGVFGEYRFLGIDDVRGWHLAHARLARWLGVGPIELSGNHLPRDRFSGCHDARVRKAVKARVTGVNLTPPDELRSTPPAREPALAPTEIPGELGPVIADCQRIHELWATGKLGTGAAGRPSEAELIAHVTVPLLRAIGWSAEQVAVGWNHIDLAVFRAAPRCPKNCALVIEQKRLNDGLLWAEGQGRGYLRKHGLEGRVPLLVTDGTALHLARADGTGVQAGLLPPTARTVELIDELRPSA